MKLFELTEYLPSNWPWADMSAKTLKASRPDPNNFGDPKEYEEYLSSWQAEIQGRHAYYDKDATKAINLIKENCQPYLEQNPRLIPMFRGSKYTGDNIFAKPIRNDRKPKDLDAKWTAMWNEGLASRGIKANRTNSAFCTGDKHFAVQYGEPFVVFPIGDFDYSWLPYVRDLYRDISGYFGAAHQEVMISNYIKRHIPEVQADNGTLVQAIHSDGEILIHCSTLLYIHAKLYEHIEDRILEALVFN